MPELHRNRHFRQALNSSTDTRFITHDVTLHLHLHEQSTIFVCPDKNFLNIQIAGELMLYMLKAKMKN